MEEAIAMPRIAMGERRTCCGRCGKGSPSSSPERAAHALPSSPIIERFVHDTRRGPACHRRSRIIELAVRNKLDSEGRAGFKEVAIAGQELVAEASEEPRATISSSTRPETCARAKLGFPIPRAKIRTSYATKATSKAGDDFLPALCARRASDDRQRFPFGDVGEAANECCFMRDSNRLGSPAAIRSPLISRAESGAMTMSARSREVWGPFSLNKRRVRTTRSS